MQVALRTPLSPILASPSRRGSWRMTDSRRIAHDLRERRDGALERVYEEFGSTVFAYLVSAFRDRSTAEDVQQDVFLEVWKRAPEYDPARGSLAAWIMVIARSRAIDNMRRRVPEPRDLDFENLVADASAEQAGDDAVDRWLVGHMLSRLPDHERALLRMRFYSDMSQSQIAHETGIPLGTVKMRMADGLRRLRDFLDGDAP